MSRSRNKFYTDSFFSPGGRSASMPAAFGLNRQLALAMDLGDNEGFAIGARCRLSAVGSSRIRRRAGDHCIIIGISKTGTQIRVQFESDKTPQTLHRSYLELVSPEK